MISVELLEQPSIEHRTIIASTTVSESSWMDPYISFLSDGSLPTDSKELEKVRRTSTRFWLSEDKRLYQRSFGGPYLLCLHPNRVTELLVELHKAICDGHLRGRFLSHRAMTQDFGGQVCSRTRPTTLKNVTNAKDMPNHSSIAWKPEPGH